MCGEGLLSLNTRVEVCGVKLSCRSGRVDEYLPVFSRLWDLLRPMLLSVKSMLCGWQRVRAFLSILFLQV
jgi:hypothetical protein